VPTCGRKPGVSGYSFCFSESEIRSFPASFRVSATVCQFFSSQSLIRYLVCIFFKFNFKY
jgi:hypothetical protein